MTDGVLIVADYRHVRESGDGGAGVYQWSAVYCGGFHGVGSAVRTAGEGKFVRD